MLWIIKILLWCPEGNMWFRRGSQSVKKIKNTVGSYIVNEEINKPVIARNRDVCLESNVGADDSSSSCKIRQRWKVQLAQNKYRNKLFLERSERRKCIGIESCAVLSSKYAISRLTEFSNLANLLQPRVSMAWRDRAAVSILWNFYAFIRSFLRYLILFKTTFRNGYLSSFAISRANNIFLFTCRLI